MTMTKSISKFIGDKAFYKHTLAIAVPIMIQNGITNFVNLLDNIMVGRIGTEQMSGVAIVNQLVMIYFLCIFGGVAGAGIFTAQYYGEHNDDGIRLTVRFKIWIGIFITVIATSIFIFWGDPLISAFLNSSDSGGDLAAALGYGKDYLSIILLGFPAFMMLQVYTGTLRECNETVTPMKAGIVAVIVNLALNYVLIYGKLGFPALGVKGAAIATVVARYTEAITVIVWAHTHKHKYSFIQGLYLTMRIPLSKFRQILMKGLPLLVNEGLWASGMATLTQCYSTRGLSVIAGLNIANTIFNMFSVVFIAMGNTVAIIVGQLLGAGKTDEAKDTDTKLVVFSVMCSTAIALVMLVLAPLFPSFYNTTPLSKEIAMQFIIAQAVFMPQNAYIHAAYFTLRSGGKTIVTFLFDSVFMWFISIPVAFILSRYTAIPAIYIFIVVQIVDWIKCLIGYILVKKGVWLQNLVENT